MVNGKPEVPKAAHPWRAGMRRARLGVSSESTRTLRRRCVAHRAAGGPLSAGSESGLALGCPGLVRTLATASGAARVAVTVTATLGGHASGEFAAVTVCH